MKAIFQPTIQVLWFTDWAEISVSATREFFARSGVAVQFESSVQEFKAGFSGKPDIVLADWDTDGLDGRKTVAEFLARDPRRCSIPAILMTDRYVSPAQTTALAQEGFRWVLRKPVVLSSLPKLIKRTVSNPGYGAGSLEATFDKLTRIIPQGDTASGAGYLAVCGVNKLQGMPPSKRNCPVPMLLRKIEMEGLEFILRQRVPRIEVSAQSGLHSCVLALRHTAYTYEEATVNLDPTDFAGTLRRPASKARTGARAA